MGGGIFPWAKVESVKLFNKLEGKDMYLRLTEMKCLLVDLNLSETGLQNTKTGQE